MEHLRAIEHAPGVAMHEVPLDSHVPEFDDDDLNCAATRRAAREGQGGGEDDEFYEDDRDQDR